MKKTEFSSKTIDNKGNVYFVRVVRVSDAENLKSFYNKLSKKSTYLFYPHSFERQRLKTLLKRTADARILLFVKQTQKLVGYAFASKVWLCNIGYFGVAIADSFQGKGLGKKLTRLLLKYAKSLGLKKIILNVYNINRNAIKVYKDQGFRKYQISSLFRYYLTTGEIVKGFGPIQLIKNSIKMIRENKNLKKDESVWMILEFKKTNVA